MLAFILASEIDVSVVEISQQWFFYSLMDIREVIGLLIGLILALITWCGIWYEMGSSRTIPKTTRHRALAEEYLTTTAGTPTPHPVAGDDSLHAPSHLIGAPSCSKSAAPEV